MSSTQLDLNNDEDINHLREQLRTITNDHGFSKYETTKIVTASSEISRNILEYTEGGSVRIERSTVDGTVELKLIFVDVGPGIKDVDQAMEDGYQGENSTGLGVGLPGARRLSDEFNIESDLEKGTTVRLLIRSTERNTKSANSR